MDITFTSNRLSNIEDLQILRTDNENKIYISIIIPCYNVENYIDRCLESIVNQTIGIKNLQIIAVNDASTDKTLSKLKEWKNRFPEEIIVVSYKENLRQGGARNIGIQCADGEYIGFVDSDDWIESDMYEKLYEKIKYKKYDVVKGKFIREHFVGEIEILNNSSKTFCYEFEKKNGFYICDTPDIGINGECGGIYTAIYRKELILKNNIWFPEKIAYEDNYWSSILHLYVQNMCIIDRVIYHYFINGNSTVTAKNAFHHLDRLNIEILKVEEFKKRGAFETLYSELEWEFIQLFYLNTLYIIFTRFTFIPPVYDFMRDKMYLYFPDFMKNPKIEQQCNKREKLLLSLLEIPRDLTEEELERIKRAYLKTFKRIPNDSL